MNPAIASTFLFHDELVMKLAVADDALRARFDVVLTSTWLPCSPIE
jgi:hypothetical protein